MLSCWLAVVAGIDWTIVNPCGVNSVYVYLRLHSANISFAAVAQKTPVGPKGTSLHDASRVVNELGIPSAVYKVNDSQFTSLAPPFIAHFGGSGKYGHLVVVNRIDADVVHLIDGTTGAPEQMTTAQFLHLWTGYIVARTPERQLLAYVAAFQSVILLLFLLARLPLRWRFFAGALALLMLGQQVAQCGEPRPHGLSRDQMLPPDQLLRSEMRSGMNCLYLACCIEGRPTDGILDASALDGTLNDLEKASRKSAMPLSAVHLTMRELHKQRYCICYVEEQTGRPGHFVLALAPTSGLVWIVHGGLGIITQMTEDEFRMIWKGIGLVPADDHRVYRIVSVAIGLVLGILFASRCRKSNVYKAQT